MQVTETNPSRRPFHEIFRDPQDFSLFLLPLPPVEKMSPAFDRRKEAILAQLAIPEGEYTDLSPKGTVDAGVRDLVDEINALAGFVTTSSCAGRVAVFLEGAKKKAAAATTTTTTTASTTASTSATATGEVDHDSGDAIAGVGGKGGGRWLFVSHDPVDLGKLEDDGELLSALGVPVQEDQGTTGHGSLDLGTCQLLHLKFEPLVRGLHRFRFSHDSRSFADFPPNSPIVHLAHARI
jgi:tRNA wybutosine-synthesizing protein 3